MFNYQFALPTVAGKPTIENSWIEKFFTVHILLPGADQFNDPERYLEVVREHAVEFIVNSEVPEARLTIDALPEKGIQGEEHFFIKPGRHQIRMSKDNFYSRHLKIEYQLLKIIRFLDK